MSTKLQVILAAILVIGVAYYIGVQVKLENEGGKSFAENESLLESSINACRRAQKNGELIGVPAGSVSGLILEGELIDQKGGQPVKYPAEARCIVFLNAQKLTFNLRKEDPSAQWIVLGLAP